jgi:hypothetical protein
LIRAKEPEPQRALDCTSGRSWLDGRCRAAGFSDAALRLAAQIRLDCRQLGLRSVKSPGASWCVYFS